MTTSSCYRLALCAAAALLCCSRGYGADTISPAYLPQDALAVVHIRVSDLFDNPQTEMLPIEIAEAWTKENLGIELRDLANIKIVIGPPDAQQPPIAAILNLTSDYSVEQLSESVVEKSGSRSLGGLTVYPLRDIPRYVLHMPDSRTVLIGTEGYLPQVVAARSAGTGDLVALLETVDASATVTAAVALRPLRPMLQAAAAEGRRQLPPPLQGLADAPSLIDAVVVQYNIADPMQQRLELRAPSPEAAQRLDAVLQQSLGTAEAMVVAQLTADIRETGPVGDATRQYVRRVAGIVADSFRPERVDDKVVVEIEGQNNVATTGVLVGLLLPAVQAAREASRRMTASNNLKQIALSLHNYHAAHGHLPPPAITDDNGQPLLSWRVAILPFLEEQQLYQRFRLDEPWDSEHNRALIASIPQTYVDPSAVVEPGETVFHLVTGEEIGVRPEGGTSFREITDGLSRTVLAVEGNQQSAVIWTRPETLQIDRSDPMANMGDAHQGGFHVVLFDGSVRFIENSLDPRIFWRALTRSGD